VSQMKYDEMLAVFMNSVTEYSISRSQYLVLKEFADWLDSSVGLTTHEVDTPTYGAIVQPDYAATADCSQCGEGISWNGRYWVHTRSNPRHPGVPKPGTYRNPPHM
jgi:hypothetical protein